MPSLFAITTATNNVSLNQNRQGQVSFTVSNTTPQSLRGHARLWVQPIAAGSWLKLLGETERDFASNESQQYTVQISVPPGSSPGEYTFRLNMVEVTNPDETLSEGPTVRFTVPTPPVVKPKPFPWWIVAAVIGAIILLVGGSVGIARLTQKPTPTPTVVSLTPTPTPDLAGRYDGNWVNDNPNTNGITRLTITHTGQTITVHGYGKCEPTDCDWNTRSGPFTGEPFVILFDFGGGLTEQLTISLAGPQHLQVIDLGSASGTNTYFFHPA